MWRLLRLTILLFLLIPIVSWLVWYCKPKVKMNLVLMDKTVVDDYFSEHRSFFWMINQRRWIKNNGQEYDFTKDYLGFHKLTYNSFEEKDLNKYKQECIQNLLDTTDIILFADNYGVYSKQWIFHENYNKDTIEFLYGGIQESDLDFLECAMNMGKVILVEFNLYGPVLKKSVAKRAEELLGVKRTGWVGKYFHNLNHRTNKNLPQWIPLLYKRNYNQEYHFHKGGIVLVNKDKIIVLENKTHLTEEFPVLKSSHSIQVRFNVPEKIYYPFWFEINNVDHSGQVLANFELKVSKEGRRILKEQKIPLQFPAIIEEKRNYHLMYFSYDFSDNPIGIYSSYFYGINRIKHMLYDSNKKNDRKKFFWEYYYPFMNALLNEVECNK